MSAWSGGSTVKPFSLFAFAVLSLLLGSTAIAGPDLISVQKNVPYGQNSQQQLDVYSRHEAGSHRVGLILVHGGGWGGGDKREVAYLGHLAAQRGMVAIAVNYRLADGTNNGMWPAQFEDLERAIGWVRRNHIALGIDIHRICALGGSAGGHLVALLAVSGDRITEPVSCVVDEFGPSDLLTFFASPPVNWFGRGDPETMKKKLKEASPAYMASSQAVPMLIVQGTKDTKVNPEQSQELYRALVRAGAPVQYLTFSGGHGFLGLGSAEYTALLERELDFVQESVGRH